VGALAARRVELGEATERLRPVEDIALRTFPLADPVLDDLEEVAHRLRPGARGLRQALPDLNAFLASGDPFRRNTRKITVALDPVVRALTPSLTALRVPAASAEPANRALAPATELLARYRSDIRATGRALVEVTRKIYPEGPTAPNHPALRFSGVLTCHDARDPYPEPGEALGQRSRCR
jgi:ABC-type transporter Mla subunit MlaD